MKEQRAESSRAPFEATGETSEESWNEAHTRAILEEWACKEDTLHRDCQPSTGGDGIFEGTEKEVAQRLNEIFFLEPSNK